LTSATSLHKKCVSSRWETPVVRGPSVLQLLPTEITGVIWWYDMGAPASDHICSGSTRVYLAQDRRQR